LLEAEALKKGVIAFAAPYKAIPDTGRITSIGSLEPAVKGIAIMNTFFTFVIEVYQKKIK
jgi:hypothetical protein